MPKGAKNKVAVAERRLDELTPCEKNVKKHDEKQIRNVAESIKQFGFVQPIVVDKAGVIVIGHCRYEAAKLLGLETVPCISVDQLPEEDVRKLRLVDNKSNESPWDMELLTAELPALDMSGFDFTFGGDFDASMQKADELDATDEYDDFVEKFKPKRTTDDCYTPEKVYDAILAWACREYKISKKNIVRPFFPGGDFEHFPYSKNSVVIDNPPFSILSRIVAFYNERKIKFFLFAPSLTAFSSFSARNSCFVVAHSEIIYMNGAKVVTSFITNLEEEGLQLRTCPELYAAIAAAQENQDERPRYSYPDELLTASKMGLLSKAGIDFSVPRRSCKFITALDSQRDDKKTIYGGGFLLSEKLAAEKLAAVYCPLSDREKAIIKSLKD